MERLEVQEMMKEREQSGGEKVQLDRPEVSGSNIWQEILWSSRNLVTATCARASQLRLSVRFKKEAAKNKHVYGLVNSAPSDSEADLYVRVWATCTKALGRVCR